MCFSLGESTRTWSRRGGPTSRQRAGNSEGQTPASWHQCHSPREPGEGHLLRISGSKPALGDKGVESPRGPWPLVWGCCDPGPYPFLPRPRRPWEADRSGWGAGSVTVTRGGGCAVRACDPPRGMPLGRGGTDWRSRPAISRAFTLGVKLPGE